MCLVVKRTKLVVKEQKEHLFTSRMVEGCWEEWGRPSRHWPQAALSPVTCHQGAQ